MTNRLTWFGCPQRSSCLPRSVLYCMLPGLAFKLDHGNNHHIHHIHHIHHDTLIGWPTKDSPLGRISHARSMTAIWGRIGSRAIGFVWNCIVNFCVSQYCNNTWGRRVLIGFSDRVWRDVPEVDPDTRGQKKPISTSTDESIGITLCVWTIIPRGGHSYTRHP